MDYGAEPMTENNPDKNRTQRQLMKAWYFENQLMHFTGNQKTAGSNLMGINSRSIII